MPPALYVATGVFCRCSPPYHVRCVGPYSLQPSDPPALSYSGTVGWKAVPVRVAAKARISSEFVDVQIKPSLALLDAVVSKLQFAVDVPPSLYPSATVAKCSSKPSGAHWRSEKSQLLWTVASMSADEDPGMLQARLYLTPSQDTEHGASAAPHFVDLRVQCMYSVASHTATDCTVEVGGCSSHTSTSSLIVKCLVLPS
jgi:hypothetical protein